MSKILIIDDRKDNLISIEALIKTNKPEHKIITAMSGEEGIKKARKEKPDTILLDVFMPKMDGFEVCVRLRQYDETQHTPIIFLTAVKTSVQDKIKGLEIGGDAYLTKPIDQGELMAQLNVMLRIKKVEDELKLQKESLEDVVAERTKDLEKQLVKSEEQRIATLSLLSDLNESTKELQIEINERKKAEYKIRESQQRLSSHLDHTPLAGIFWDVDFKVTDWNKSAEKIFGYKKEEALGKHAIELIVPKEIQPQISDVFLQLLAQTGGKRSTNEKDGKRILCDWYNVSVTDLNGKVTGVASLVDDITERKKIEDDLKKSEATFKLLLEKLPSAVFLTKLTGENAGEIIYANPAAAKQTGYEQSKLHGMNIIYDFFVDKNTVDLKETREKDLKKGKTISFIERKKHANGSIYITQAMIVPIEYENETTTLSVNTDITKQFEAQEKIKESEDKYRKLFENNSAGVYVFNIAGKILDCNEAFKNMFGYSSKEEVLKTDAINFYQNKEERELFLKKLQTKKELLNFESRTKRKDGSFIYTIENAQLIGENILQATVLDITELKNAEIALKASNEFNKSLIDTIPFGLDIVDMEGNILFMNDLLKDVVGIEEIRGKCWELYNDNGRQCAECPLKKELKLGITNIIEAHGVFGGREYEITQTVMNYKNQKALLEVFRDITESKKAQKEILKLSRGLEQSPAMVVITDTDGNIEYINPKVTEITGYELEEVKGKNPRIFQSGSTTKKIYEEIWRIILNGETWEGEILNKKKNGDLYWELERISPILNSNGEIINFLGIKEDITEKIKARKELIKAKEKAEEINRIKSNFFANMSHELRTPFVGIMGYAEILKETINDPQAVKLANGILDSSNRLRKTLTEILDFSKIESEKITVNMEVKEIHRIISDCANLFVKSVEVKNLELNVDIQFDKLEMRIDEKLFMDILNNLISNAVKYTIRGWIDIIAATELIDGKEYLIVKVKDTGIGISKDKKDVIWDEFRQASEGYNRNFEGTGLGLSITKHYVHLLCGKIYVESEENKGTVFTVELPVMNVDNTDQTVTGLKQNHGSGNAGKEKCVYKKLLYVEDDNFALFFVAKILSKYYELETASDGKTGLKMAKENKYDALLLDINLGEGLDGAELMEAVRKIPHYKNAPIIAVTAYAEDKDRIEFISRGFTKVLTKPFTKGELLDSVNDIFKEGKK